MEFNEVLRTARTNRVMHQRDMANALGCSKSAYASIEQGRVGFRSYIVRGMLDSELFTKKERRDLGLAYDRMKKRIIDEESGIIEKAEVKDAKTLKKESKFRIPNIPNFYKDLNALGKLSELDPNDPRLQAMRNKVGAKKAYQRREAVSKAYPSRKKLAIILKDIRRENQHTMESVADQIGVLGQNYRVVEYGQRGSTSLRLRDIITSDYYTEKQRETFRAIFYDMQDEEREAKKNGTKILEK